jgi:hypothetical protein
MYSLNEVLMTETEYDRVHASQYHYWAWAAKFYIRRPACLWRDLWWKFMPGEIVRFNSFVGWNRGDFEHWCRNNVGIKNISWGLRIDNWVKDEGYDFAIKVRKGKTQLISHLALIVR